MSNKVNKIMVATLRSLIEVERERLKKLREDKPEWWEHSSDWAKREFGKDLDGAITDVTISYNAKSCNICGGSPKIDEKFLCLEFSFCDEYDCDMNICRACLKGLAKRL